jgi:hypothetical protein
MRIVLLYSAALAKVVLQISRAAETLLVLLCTRIIVDDSFQKVSGACDSEWVYVQIRLC